MSTNPHPAQQWLSDRDAAEALAYDKLHSRVQVADAAEVRNTDYSGQFGGLYIRSLLANFRLDTDSTDADDGVNVVIDGAGNHFLKVVDSAEPSQRLVTAVGAVTIAADDADIIIIKKTAGAATTVNLPSAADRTKAVQIVDGKGDAASNNITIIPVSGESVMATVDYRYVIDGNGGSVILRPLADGTGWI